MDFTIIYILQLIERVSVIATLAFILTRWTWFRNLLERRSGPKTRLISIVIFGLIGVLGTYTGIVVRPEGDGSNVGIVASINAAEAIINARVIGVAIGGILGGPLMGMASGAIAAAHRYSMGGFTAVACSVSTIWEGLLAGFIAHRLLKGRPSIWHVGMIGITAELSQMLIILLLAKPFDQAWELVKIIGIPMILANSLGLAVFFAILQSVIQREQEAVACFANTALSIADKTLPYLRKGLSVESARQAAEIIQQKTGVLAVALTDTDKILAFVGKGDDHHIADTPLQTESTYTVIREGKACVAENKQAIGCSHPDCPLAAAVILPLRQRGDVIGTLKLYFNTPTDITPSQIELTNGLANLFSTQLELARLGEQERLLAEAEIKALQAQVNPHFLFNALNTIVALIRKEPPLARQIATQLGQFLRSNLLAGNQRWRTLGDEINHIRDYLAIETVRFRDKLSVHYDIDERVLTYPVPPLILLPLVENAIKHGVVPLIRTGELRITVAGLFDTITVLIEDNGKGMDSARLNDILSGRVSHNEQGIGFGVYSVIHRMEEIYGTRATVKIDSRIDQGTRVTLFFPAGQADMSRV